MMQKSKLVSYILVCSIALVGWTTACTPSSQQDASSQNSSTSKQSAQDIAPLNLSGISTVTPDGTAVSWADFKGEKLTVLNVWATWCPPCVEEIPYLQTIQEGYQGQGVQVVGVLQDAIDDFLEPQEEVIATANTLFADANASYPIILPDELIMQELVSQMQYFPTTFFLNADGDVIGTAVGANDADGWSKKIDEMLQKLQ